MTNYQKLSELINLKLVCKYARGFENWKTKYGSGDPFRVARLKDFKKGIATEGNFEVATPQKGVKRSEWNWQTETFEQGKWASSFSWTFLNGEDENKVELTWLQNKNLIDKLPEQFPQTGVSVTPKISDKTVDFVVDAPAEQNAPVAPTPEAEELGDSLPF